MTRRCVWTLLCCLWLAPLCAQDQALEAAVAQIDSRVLIDPVLAGVRVRAGERDQAGALRRLADAAGGWLERLPGGASLLHGPGGRPLGALGGASVSVIGTEVSALARRIAVAGELALRVDAAVAGPCSLDLREMPAIVALEVLARLAQADLWRADSGEWQLTPTRRISVDRMQGTLGQVAAEVARAGGLSLVCGPEPEHLPVSVAALGRTAPELLGALAAAGDVPLGAGRVWTLGSAAPLDVPLDESGGPPRRPGARSWLQGLLPLRGVLLKLAAAGQVDLVVGPNVRGDVRVELQGSSWSDALSAVAAVCSLSIHVEGGQRFVTSRALLPPASAGGRAGARRALARGAPASVWFSSLASEAGIRVDLPDPFPARIHARFTALPAGRAFALSAWSHGYSLRANGPGSWRLELPDASAAVPARAPPLSPSTDALLRHLERAAVGGQASRARQALDLLESMPRGPQPSATASGESLRQDLEAALTALSAADPPGRAEPLARLERLVSEGGQPASLCLRRLLVRWDRRWADDATRQSAHEVLTQASAQRLLGGLRRAYLDGAALEARDTYRALLDLIEDAGRVGLDPAWIEELQAEAASEWDIARPLLELQHVPLALTGAIGEGGGRAAVAIVNGHAVRPGEQVLDEAGKIVPGLSLLGVDDAGANFDYRGRRFSRPLSP